MKNKKIGRFLSILYAFLLIFTGFSTQQFESHAAETLKVAKYVTETGMATINDEKTLATYDGNLVLDLDMVELMQPFEGNMEVASNTTAYPWADRTKQEVAFVSITLKFPHDVELGNIDLSSLSTVFPKTSNTKITTTSNSVNFKLPLTDQNWKGVYNAYKNDKQDPQSHKVTINVPYKVSATSKEEAAALDGSVITSDGSFSFSSGFISQTTKADSISLPLTKGLADKFEDNNQPSPNPPVDPVEKTDITSLDFTSPEYTMPSLGSMVPQDFNLAVSDDNSVITEGKTETFLSWRKKLDDGTWDYASNDGTFKEGTYRLRFDIQNLSPADAKKFTQVPPTVTLNGEKLEFTLEDGINDSYWVLNPDQTVNLVFYSSPKNVSPEVAPSQPIKINSTINLNSDIELNGNTSHDNVVVVKKNDILNFKGIVNVKPIKDQMVAIESKTTAPLETIKVENLNVGFTATLKLPEGMVFTDTLNYVPEGTKDIFKVEKVERVDDKTAMVTFKLSDIENIKTYLELKNKVYAVDDELKVTLEGAKFTDSSMSNTDYTVEGTITGDFNGRAINAVGGKTIDFTFAWNGVQEPSKADSKYLSSEKIYYTVKYIEPSKIEAEGNLPGDILIGDDTQHDKVYMANKGDVLTITGALDVTPIKNELKRIEAQFPSGAANPAGIDVTEYATNFYATVTLPEGLHFTDAPIITLKGANGKFKIAKQEINGKVANIELVLSNDIDTYDKVQDAVNSVEETLKVDIEGVAFDQDAVALQNYTIRGTVKGEFKAKATKRDSKTELLFSYVWNGIQKDGGQDFTALDSDEISFTLAYDEMNEEQPPMDSEKPSNTTEKPNKNNTKITKKTPKTGDNIDIFPLGSILVISMITLTGALLRRKSN